MHTRQLSAPHSVVQLPIAALLDICRTLWTVLLWLPAYTTAKRLAHSLSLLAAVSVNSFVNLSAFTSSPVWILITLIYHLLVQCLICHWWAVTPNYCSTTPPTPLNTQTPSSFVNTVGSVTSYTCQLGYVYSSVWGGPAVTCKARDSKSYIESLITRTSALSWKNWVPEWYWYKWSSNYDYQTNVTRHLMNWLTIWNERYMLASCKYCKRAINKSKQLVEHELISNNHLLIYD